MSLRADAVGWNATEDFQTSATARVSMRDCLWPKEKCSTATYASVRHNLGTNLRTFLPYPELALLASTCFSQKRVSISRNFVIAVVRCSLACSTLAIRR